MLLLATIPVYDEADDQKKVEVAPDKEVEKLKRLLG
jgi:hypothetical protein